MRSRVLFPVLFIFSLDVFAQQNQFAKADWVGECYTDYRLSIDIEKDNDQWNSLQVLKLEDRPHENGFGDCFDCAGWFFEKMMRDWAFDEQLRTFEDAELSVPLDFEERQHWMSSIDTVVMIDPNDYSEILQVVRNEVNFDDIIGLRVFHRLFFEKKTEKLSVEVVSVAPLLKILDDAGNFRYVVPMFWIKADQVSPHLDMREVDYIVQTISRDKSPKLNMIETKKGQIDFKNHLNRLLEQREGLFSADGNFDPVDEEETLYMLNGGVDTTVTFDPETYAETIEVKRQPPAAESLSSIRFVFNWYFDDKEKQIYYENIGYSPVVDVTNDKGELLYTKPIFYRRARD